MIATEKSGIKSVPDLKGKPVALQQMSAGITSVFQLTLDAYGMSEKDLKIVTRGGTGQCIAAVKDRRADFFVAGATIPSGDISEISTILPVKILSVDDVHFQKLRKKTPVFLKTIIPAGTYKRQDADVIGVGAPTIVFANESFPDDYAYWIVKTFVENIDNLRAVSKALKTISPEFMATPAGIKIHPGAARYLKEIGVLK